MTAPKQQRRTPEPLSLTLTAVWIIVATILLLLSAEASATTVVAVRTPTDIYVGAESKVKFVDLDDTVTYGEQCKIGQAGNVFFAAAGPYGRKASGLDVRLSLLNSQRPGATLYQTFDKFDEHYITALGRTLEELQKEAPILYERFLERKQIHVFLLGFERDVPVMSHRLFTYEKRSDSRLSLHVTFSNCPPGCGKSEPNMAAVFQGEVAKDLLLSKLTTLPPVQLINQVIEASIKAEPEESGGPIDILHLNKDGAEWIQRKQGCPRT